MHKTYHVRMSPSLTLPGQGQTTSARAPHKSSWFLPRRLQQRRKDWWHEMGSNIFLKGTGVKLSHTLSGLIDDYDIIYQEGIQCT